MYETGCCFMSKILFFILFVLFAFLKCNNDCDTYINKVCTVKGNHSRECVELKQILKQSGGVDLNCNNKEGEQRLSCKKNELIYNSIILEKEKYCKAALEILHQTGLQ